MNAEVAADIAAGLVSDDDVRKYFADSRLYADWSGSDQKETTKDTPSSVVGGGGDETECDDWHDMENWNDRDRWNAPKSLLLSPTAADSKSAPASKLFGSPRFGGGGGGIHPSSHESSVEYNTSALFVARHPKPLHNDERSATIWSNSQSMLPPIDELCAKAWTKYQSGAYLHHYEKYGVSASDFQSAFVDIERVIYDYKSL